MLCYQSRVRAGKIHMQYMELTWLLRGESLPSGDRVNALMQPSSRFSFVKYAHPLALLYAAYVGFVPAATGPCRIDEGQDAAVSQQRVDGWPAGSGWRVRDAHVQQAE